MKSVNQTKPLKFKLFANNENLKDISQKLYSKTESIATMQRVFMRAIEKQER